MDTPQRVQASVSRASRAAWGALLQPTFALPVDCFRLGMGLLSFCYFFQLILEIPDFSSPTGLLDHALLLQMHSYLRWSLFQPGLAEWHLYLLFSLGLGAATLVTIGWHPKWAAGCLFLLVVSTYRWNFLVVYLDDGLMHLALAWLLLLPIGHTLRFSEWWRDGPRAWARWQERRVPGVAVRSFLANLALIYLVAGSWKWTSPMWLEGSALFAGLNLPMAYAPDVWRPELLPFLKFATHTSLVLEVCLAFLVILPRHHPLKWSLAAGGAALHLGIILTLRIPYANTICLLGLLLVFRHELMQALRVPASRQGALPGPASPPRLDWPGRFALLLVALLTLTMLGDALPWWKVPRGLSRQPGPDQTVLAPGQVEAARRAAEERKPGTRATTHNPAHYPLWLVGIAQSYRLFDWIDEVNFMVHYEIIEAGTPAITGRTAERRLFPATARGAILQGYLHDVRWVIVPAPYVNEFKQGLFARLAHRYCATHAPRRPVEVFATVERISLDNLRLDQGRRELLMAFDCSGATPTVMQMRLSPELGAAQLGPAFSSDRDSRQ